MTTLDSIWATTQADGDFEKNEPPAGTVGVARLSGHRVGKSRKGELYFAIDLVDDSQGYSWGIYKEFTKNGQPVEGRIKSAKITLRQVGVDIDSPQLLDAALKPLAGRFFTYEHIASSTINTTTGAPYLNTNITGVASPPVQQQAAAPVSTQVQTPQGVASFPSAVAPAPDPMLAPALPVQPSPMAVPVAGPTLDQVLTGNPVPQGPPPAGIQAAIDANHQLAPLAPGQVDLNPLG